MENISELKQHLNAIEQTRQISNAMYLLSTSRMKKSMQNISYNLSYMKRLRSTMKDIVSKTKHNDLSDPFLELTEGGKALYFAVTSDKGLCGGYNSAIVNLTLDKMREHRETVLYSLGLKGTELFKNRGVTPASSWYGASQKPSLHLATELAENIVSLYDEREVSEVYIVYTKYVNSAVQVPECRRILPLLRRDFDDVEYENKYETEVIYEPDIQTVFDRAVPQYIIGMVYDYFPYMVLPIYSILAKLDGRLLEAARDLGCGSLSVLRRVIIPLSMPGVISGITMVLIPSISTFYISQKLGNGKFFLIGDAIEGQYVANNLHFAAAIAFILMLILLACMTAVKYVTARYVYGGDEE